MRRGNVLNLIWQGEVSLPAEDRYTGFEALFSQILPVRCTALLAGGECSRPLAMADGLELAPSLPLGDVLVEELPLDLPYDTLVLFLPRSQTDLSRLMGGAVGETLQLMLSLGNLPMERETDALYLMAHAAARRAAALRAGGAALDIRAFCEGLGRSLGQYWLADQRSLLPDPNLFARPDFLWQPQLRAYLTELDPGFSAPDPHMIDDDLLCVSDDPLGLDDWAERMEIVLRAVLGAPERENLPLQSGFPSRFNLQ
ncbi:hypothetical protein M4578_22370 [Salipiger sp. P9]|uniref:hypothetical protein n=1 Tax=Salipiger pentaromativorans TaxID=2943193 RepID=UPI0021570B87|nr:hypothetical protein [Salipiger pentaromativorans]MCR8550577.1 hypothetical protein [Salipiger pentaromativorans]